MMKPLWALIAIAAMPGCADPDASCTTNAGTEQQMCYELGPDNDDVGNIQATCSDAGGTFTEAPCDTSGALFSCTDTLVNFFNEAAANEVRTLRFNYYFWNPGFQAGGHCVNAGGTFEQL